MRHRALDALQLRLIRDHGKRIGVQEGFKLASSSPAPECSAQLGPHALSPHPFFQQPQDHLPRFVAQRHFVSRTQTSRANSSKQRDLSQVLES